MTCNFRSLGAAPTNNKFSQILQMPIPFGFFIVYGKIVVWDWEREGVRERESTQHGCNTLNIFWQNNTIYYPKLWWKWENSIRSRWKGAKSINTKRIVNPTDANEHKKKPLTAQILHFIAPSDLLLLSSTIDHGKHDVVHPNTTQAKFFLLSKWAG